MVTRARKPRKPAKQQEASLDSDNAVEDQSAAEPAAKTTSSRSAPLRILDGIARAMTPVLRKSTAGAADSDEHDNCEDTPDGDELSVRMANRAMLLQVKQNLCKPITTLYLFSSLSVLLLRLRMCVHCSVSWHCSCLKGCCCHRLRQRIRLTTTNPCCTPCASFCEHVAMDWLAQGHSQMKGQHWKLRLCQYYSPQNSSASLPWLLLSC
jgi:hypothetical protein